MKYIAHPVLAAEDSKEKDKYAYVVYAEDEKFDDPDVRLFWCEDGSAEVMSKKDADHFTYEEALKLEKMRGKHKWKMERVPHYGTNVSSSEMIRSDKPIRAARSKADELREGSFFPSPRENTNYILELLDDGIIDGDSLARDLLEWLSEDEVTEFCRVYGYEHPEPEDDEYDEIEED